MHALDKAAKGKSRAYFISMYDPLVCIHICCSDKNICVVSEYIV
jgi:hypothetical protein